MNKDITPYNTKDQRHGLWELYWNNGKLRFKCIYINGKENGFEQLYWGGDGKITYKNYYL